MSNIEKEIEKTRNLLYNLIKIGVDLCKMAKSKSYAKAKKRLMWLCGFLVVLVGLVIQSVFKDWMQIFENKSMKNELTLKYNNLLEEEKKLEAEVTKLQDPEYVARYAREKYGYTKDGELIFRIDE